MPDILHGRFFFRGNLWREGLECGYEDGDQLENQGHHQWVCESRVGTTGGQGPGRGEEALVQCHFPMLWSVIGVSGM